VTYLAHSESDRAQMLAAIGVASVDELFAPVPEELRSGPLELDPGLSESETHRLLEQLAARNTVPTPRSFLGAGCYRHHVPAAVRALTARSEFATAYTPYQAEVSQGTLQHIFEFQTAVCELTGLEVANASLYDGPTALAEACFLGLRQTRRETIVLSAGVHPEARQVAHTYASGPGFELRTIALEEPSGRTPVPDRELLEGAGVLAVQQPNWGGIVEDLRPLAQAAHEAGALLVVSQNPMTLGVLAAPGAEGADVAVGDVQVFGNAPSYGGPTAGYLACRQQSLRQLPGRLVGQTIDRDGRTCYALALQAREQHIRRAKATSNICSNQALNALAATIGLALLGAEGLRRTGEVCLQRAHYLQAGLVALPGLRRRWEGPFFNEFALRVQGGAGAFRRAVRQRGIDAGVPAVRLDPGEPDTLLVAVTELNQAQDLDAYIAAAKAFAAEPTTTLGAG